MGVGHAPVTDASRERLRAEHADALDQLAAPIEAAVAEALRRVLTLATTAASPALTASADTADRLWFGDDLLRVDVGLPRLPDGMEWMTGEMADLFAEPVFTVLASAEQVPPPPIDLDALSSITTRWATEVERLLPRLQEVYELAGEYQWGRLADAFDRRTADPFTPNPQTVFADRASDFLAVARDRLVGVGDTAWSLARGTLEEGMRAGEGIDALKGRVQDTLGVAEGRARTIARTETLSAANSGATAAVRSLGPDAPPFKRWLATKDSRTRDEHWLADGQTVLLDHRFVVGGFSLDYPGDPTAPGAATINCRCSLTFEETDDE